MDYIKITGFYTYSTTFAQGNRTQIPRRLTSELEFKLWDALEKATGKNYNKNKCTFRIEDGNFKTHYITFYNFSTFIGDDHRPCPDIHTDQGKWKFKDFNDNPILVEK